MRDQVDEVLEDVMLDPENEPDAERLGFTGCFLGIGAGIMIGAGAEAWKDVLLYSLGASFFVTVSGFMDRSWAGALLRGDYAKALTERAEREARRHLRSEITGKQPMSFQGRAMGLVWTWVKVLCGILLLSAFIYLCQPYFR